MSGAVDLLGRMPVRLCAEGDDLVGYGFAGQRIAIPAAEIGAVLVHRGWGKQWGRSGPALLLLDKSERLLLRAPGIWNWGSARRLATINSSLWVDTDLNRLCSSLRVGPPRYLRSREVRQHKPLYPHAPGYRRLRVRPSGYRLLRLALVAFGMVLAGLGIAASVLLASALPPAVGDVRNMIGLVGSVAAVWAAIWLCRMTVLGLRWLAVSRSVRTIAPLDRFFGADVRRWRKAQPWLTRMMVFAIPVLIAWGPGVGLSSLADGFADQGLVSQLRQHGALTPGLVIDVPTYSTDSDGNTQVTDHATLAFRTPDGMSVQTPDPAIAGWTWPMDPYQPVTIVYDPAQPATAAVSGQISGSPWHGTPTGNVISGAVLTAALIPLTWVTVRRIRAARRESREGLFEGLPAV
jgi:hypothetical protein